MYGYSKCITVYDWIRWVCGGSILGVLLQLSRRLPGIHSTPGNPHMGLEVCFCGQ